MVLRREATRLSGQSTLSAHETRLLRRIPLLAEILDMLEVGASGRVSCLTLSLFNGDHAPTTIIDRKRSKVKRYIRVSLNMSAEVRLAKAIESEIWIKPPKGDPCRKHGLYCRYCHCLQSHGHDESCRLYVDPEIVGQKAAMSGMSITQCPYAPDHNRPAYESWRRGYEFMSDAQCASVPRL